MAVGKTGQIFPEGAGKLMADSKIHWEVTTSAPAAK
jgi:hypothetical protein